MARIKQGDEWFEIPDDDFTATQLQEKAKKDKDAVPVVIRGDKDIVVEPDEVVHLQPDDRVIFTTPVEAAYSGIDFKDLVKEGE